VVVEVTGHQFAWEFRYPGADKTLGKKDYKLTKGANSLGVDFNDPASKDDIHVPATMHIPVGKPVKLVINAQDVIHDVGLSHFRLKMDAVPGIPTTMWFTPLYTTEEMKVRTGNPNFVYEISCDQMCGKGHFSMRGVVVVEKEEDYKKWLATQSPMYYTVFPDKKPKENLVDTTKKSMPIAAL
jgi:cytochrome c oxidase subunit 2